MAPELISSLDTMIPYDERIDIWSLGITVIELAERDVPHSSVHHSRVLAVIVTEPSPSLSTRGRQHLSPNFCKFVSTCLTKVYFDPFSFLCILSSISSSFFFLHFIRLFISQEPHARPKADVLLEHPLFLNVDLEAMCNLGVEFGCSYSFSHYTNSVAEVSEYHCRFGFWIWFWFWFWSWF
jgi:serine/threonine protein kinase